MALYRAEFVGRGELNTRQISLNSHLKSLKVKTYLQYVMIAWNEAQDISMGLYYLTLSFLYSSHPLLSLSLNPIKMK